MKTRQNPCDTPSATLSRFKGIARYGGGVSYEQFFPLRGPWEASGRKFHEKWGKIAKFPSGPTTENGEKLQRNCKFCIFGVVSPLSLVMADCLQSENLALIFPKNLNFSTCLWEYWVKSDGLDRQVVV